MEIVMERLFVVQYYNIYSDCIGNFDADFFIRFVQSAVSIDGTGYHDG
jgi:hypothetical protein